MARGEGNWIELDLVRGIAGIIMVLNHAAAQWWGGPTAQGLPGALFDIGAFAPVLFFAATGVGYGIQAEYKGRTGGHRFGFARKVAILLLADSLLWLSPQSLLGNDFLGFIALTMLTLELLRGVRRGWVVALVAAAAIAGLRFVVVPQISMGPAQADPTMLDWLTGLGSPTGFAYPPLPWLAYGLVGFTAGALLQRHRLWVRKHRGPLLALMAIAAGIGVAVVLWRVDGGSTLARWGSVNGTFFVAGFAALAAATAIAFSLTHLGFEAPWLQLRGLSSLALVPIHYGVIRALGAAGITPDGPGGVIVVASLAVAISLTLASTWPTAVRWLDRRRSWAVLVGVATATIATRLLVENEAAQVIAAVTGQLALCALLVVNHRR